MSTTLETSTVPGVRNLYRLAIVSAIVSGMFCAAFIGLLLYTFNVPYRPDKLDAMNAPVPETTVDGSPILASDPNYRIPASDPFNLLPSDFKDFLDLKRRLAADKTNEQLKTRIRELDQKLRLDFFKRRDTIRSASPFLLLAAVVFLVSVRTAGVLRRRLPIPSGDPKVKARIAENRRLQLGFFAVVAVSMTFVGFAVGLLLVPAPAFEQVLIGKLAHDTAAAAKLHAGREMPAASTKQPTLTDEPVQRITGDTPKEEPLDRDKLLAELEKNWPSFRGPDGSGISKAQNLPLKWDATKDENVVWKTETPLPGKSSPILWGNRLFLTGADKEKRQVFCFDTETGKLLWTADAPSTPESAKAFEVSDDTGLAAPTAVTDGQRVYAMFANGDIVAVGFDGNVVWSKSLGIPDSSYGFSSSPALYFDRLIVQYDFGDGSEGKSKLYAFDTKTGNIAWETPRELPNSWASPIVRKIGEKYQIITCADPFVVGYDAEDGKELWRCKCLSGDIGPSPTGFGNFVVVTNQGPRTSAIDATGTGDVTKTNVLWNGSNALPDTPSPLATGKAVYTFSSQGYLTAYDPSNIKNNKAMYWELEVGGGEASFYTSPLLVGNLIYLFSMTEESPKAYIVDLSKAEIDDKGSLKEECTETMIVAANPMSEPCVTTPAAQDGRIFIRGNKSVFCFGEKK